MTTQKSGRSGAVTFAASLIVIAGTLDLIWGISALSNESYFSDDGLLTQSLTTWGWFYIIVGVIQIAVGWMVFVGSPIGYGLGMFGAFLAILINFMSVGGYPIWSVTLMVLNFFIIWALATHWSEV